VTSREEVLDKARQAGVRLVRFLYCDNDGVVRGKATHVDFLKPCLESGIGLTVAMQSFTMLDALAPEGTFGPVGEVRLMPDPETFSVLPYAPKSARMLVDLVQLDKTPWGACPRSFLKRMVERSAERGIRWQAAFENEFYLVRQSEEGFVPMDQSLCFSSVGMDEAEPIVQEIIEDLGHQGVAVEKYFPELGPGQQEIPVRHAPALRAADNQIVFRETVRGVARRNGLWATFAPKPFADLAGNGCHIHISAWEEAGRKNLFFDPQGPHQLSRLGYNFIGGVMAHLPALVALTAPSVNSYRRLKPQTWASAFTCYGPDNREAAVRIVSGYWGLEMETLRLELKCSDPSNNPYIALAGVLAAGLDGIERELEPGEPLEVDPARLSDEERASLGIKPLPASLEEAVDALKGDQVLCEAMGPVLAKEYVIVKRAVWDGFKDKGLEFELAQHFFKF
jgi:glutamine synthetase